MWNTDIYWRIAIYTGTDNYQGFGTSSMLV